MAKTTISFTIEEEQLRQVDALTERLDRDRSSTLRLLINAGMRAVEKPMTVLTDRDMVHKYATRVAIALAGEPLPDGAVPGADADLVEA